MINTLKEFNKLNPNPGIPHQEFIISSGDKKKLIYLPNWIYKDSVGYYNGKELSLILRTKVFISPQIFYDSLILGLTNEINVQYVEII